MEETDLENWNEARYSELNAYFRVKIKTMLESDPFLQEIVAQQKSMQLQDLVDRMTTSDQQRWAEFLHLDRIKLHLDLQNHLEGKGIPYNSQRGFGFDLTNEENHW